MLFGFGSGATSAMTLAMAAPVATTDLFHKVWLSGPMLQVDRSADDAMREHKKWALLGDDLFVLFCFPCLFFSPNYKGMKSVSVSQFRYKKDSKFSLVLFIFCPIMKIFRLFIKALLYICLVCIPNLFESLNSGMHLSFFLKFLAKFFYGCFVFIAVPLFP